MRNWNILERLCRLTMMVLVQDEANEFGAEMAPTELYGKLSFHRVTRRGNSTFEPIACVMRADDQILNNEIAIALES